MIDLYCERLAHGLWAEPINAVTNLSFMIAAIATWHQASRLDSLSSGIRLLIVLMISIGLGSGIFHTFATPWARIMDIVPILLFQIAFLWIYGRKIINASTGYLIVAVLIFSIAAYIARQFPYVLNGSLIYAPAFLLLLMLGIYHYYHAQTERTLLLWATGVFFVSLSLRTIDMAVCPYFPVGTHFFWHLFNGLLVYLAARSLLMNMEVRA